MYDVADASEVPSGYAVPTARRRIDTYHKAVLLRLGT